MKFAIVGSERREAEPGLSGECPACGKAMTAKCGQHRVHHWAHHGKRVCDLWFERETQWHRDWKSHFPKGWQEFVQHSESGERHIADVRTDLGVVLEFQHSFLRKDEHEAREKFYPKMVWVVDGLRRRRDAAQFFTAVRAGTFVCREPLIVFVRWREGALLRDWGEGRVPVYFDFGTPVLWRLSSSRPHGITYLASVSKAVFLQAHLQGVPFEEMCTKLVERAMVRHLIQQAPQPLSGFERYMARRPRARPRF
ncbi:competence protein CoiA [Bradyrhizobium sp. AUGA SZCCT0042]|uniref:competence protein CoiA n=1 Tax=Bradyrhizobium sp. AUGA SZCCT0042 TaxID=2807651 RepID=UPI001BA464DC|nr:competence protein [Bradyrhizobium sp. AUGA SZCCT0042]MBR1300647.1 competence protein [Bradyrhizobium sp. AUGA SZCCT0042]